MKEEKCFCCYQQASDFASSTLGEPWETVLTWQLQQIGFIYRALLVTCNCYYHMAMSWFPCVYRHSSLSCTLLDPGVLLFLSFLFFLRPEGLEAGSSTGSWSRRRNTNTSPSRTGWRDEGGGRGVCMLYMHVSEPYTSQSTVLWKTHVYVLGRVLHVHEQSTNHISLIKQA